PSAASIHSSVDAYANSTYHNRPVTVNGSSMTMTPVDDTCAVLAAQTSLSVTAPVSDDFSISASPGSLTLVQGNSGTSTIGTAVVSGSAQTVTLSASGVPAGATASFRPGAVVAGGRSTLTISTSASTPAGVYSLT